MIKDKIKKIFRFDYEILIVPTRITSKSKTYRFTSLKALMVIFLTLVISNLILIFLISYTPFGKVLPKSPYLSGEDFQQISELREKVIELSNEVERVRQINERLNLIIEGKPIPIDPRDLDTNYQKEKLKRDSMRLLGKGNFSNNIYLIFSKIFQHDDDSQIKDTLSSRNDEAFFFIKPAEGIITRGFNKEISHFGIDFGIPVGSVVRASASGIIVLADYTINDGYKIIIAHSKGYFTIYKHLSQILKRERDYVKQGDIIGLSGNTGRLTTGPHLHFEIWKYQTPIDPKKILVDLK